MLTWGNSWEHVEFRGQCPRVSVSSGLSLICREPHWTKSSAMHVGRLFSDLLVSTHLSLLSAGIIGASLHTRLYSECWECDLKFSNTCGKHFYQLHHLPNIRIFKDNEWRKFLPCFHAQQQTVEKGTQIFSEYLTHPAPWNSMIFYTNCTVNVEQIISTCFWDKWSELLYIRIAPNGFSNVLE